MNPRTIVVQFPPVGAKHLRKKLGCCPIRLPQMLRPYPTRNPDTDIGIETPTQNPIA
ncbi:hypothetical protein [Egbenema bharatensis]|uniref:hypothetical protein n=1 Tax=Egbenema bharatensis TaxID=3463334 RepID=UPI003A8B6C3D